MQLSLWIFSDFSKMTFFQKINLFEKNIFFNIKFGVKIFPKNTATSVIEWYVCVIFFTIFPSFSFKIIEKEQKHFLFFSSHNFLNNAWNNLKCWVSSLFMLVYQSLKFQVNRKHGVLNPSDLPWNPPYILAFHIYLINYF